MGIIKEPVPVKLITGMISSRTDLFQKVIQNLSEIYGPIDFSSKIIPFTYTTYYEKEMGPGLFRLFVSFGRLINPEELSSVKIVTSKIEGELARENNGEKKRQINLDPGYIALSKLVLASTKDRAHRIYLDKGIYGEVTLQYEKKTFAPWYWTYPDYRTEEYISICNSIRKTYAEQLKNLQS